MMDIIVQLVVMGVANMSYHDMRPEQHFEFMFRAKVEPTGRVRTQVQDIMPTHYTDIIPIDVPYQVEREISITMGENDYKNFMSSYGKYLDLVYAAESDIVVKDMMQKMMMYIILKK